jgi:hypothetical protein
MGMRAGAPFAACFDKLPRSDQTRAVIAPPAPFRLGTYPSLKAIYGVLLVIGKPNCLHSITSVLALVYAPNLAQVDSNFHCLLSKRSLLVLELAVFQGR